MKKENLRTVGSGKRGNRSLWLAVAVGLVCCFGVGPVVAAEAEAALGDGDFCIVATYAGEKKIAGQSGNCKDAKAPGGGSTPTPTPTEEPPTEPEKTNGYTVEQRVSPTTSVRHGDVLTYTITVRNLGTEPIKDLGPHTPGSPSLTVDLTDLRDDTDGQRNDWSMTAGSGNVFNVRGEKIVWQGSLGAKGTPSGTVVITYKAQVNTHLTGNGSIVTTLKPGIHEPNFVEYVGGSCVPNACVRTTTVLKD